MDEESKEQLINILKELPDENSCIDYKEIPYRKDKNSTASFIKDICAFVNSSEAFGKNKFIIFGIRNCTMERIGLRTVLMEDDECYQSWCEYIEPRPTIQTGIIKYNGIEYGYIFITKDNNDRVYSITKDYPDEFVSRTEQIQKMRDKVYGSTAYIRKGSKNYLLSECDRRKIYEQDRQIIESRRQYIQPYILSTEEDINKDILKICALFGTWDENNENEKKVISDVLGIGYNTWIKVLRKILNKKSNSISFKNGRWKIENKEELLEEYAENYFPEDITKFEKAALNILTTTDPKYDLAADKRYMNNIVGNKPKYSYEIKRAVAETIAYVKSIESLFINCPKEIHHIKWFVIRNVFENVDWKQLATLNTILPLLAEIDAKEYLSQLEGIINNKEDELIKLFYEKEEFVTQTRYINGLVWSLELLAWYPTHIMKAFDIFAKLAKYDERIMDSMCRILLPWNPQTLADIHLKKTTLETLLENYENFGWKLLMQLMPNKRNYTVPTYKPIWNNKIKDNIKVTNGELYNQYREYVNLAINYSRHNVDRIVQLIDIIDDLPKDLFNNIIKKIKTKDVRKLPENDRFYIWNKLENIIQKHKNYSEADWALPEEAIKKLEEVSEEIKPLDKKIYYKRLFTHDYLNSLSSKESYNVREKRILEERKEAIEDLLQEGIQKVIDFADNTEDPRGAGVALAEIKLNAKQEKNILQLLNDNNNAIAQGFIYRKYYNENDKWLNSIDFNNINDYGKALLLVQLPINKTVLKKEKELLGAKENEYWEKANIYSIDKEVDYNYTLEKLLEYKKPVKAIELASRGIYEKKELSRELVAKALMNALGDQDSIKYYDVYNIKQLIKYLQDKKYSSQELFKIEWAYLPVLDNYDEYRPITMEKMMSENPEVFMQIICLAYKAEKMNQIKKILIQN